MDINRQKSILGKLAKLAVYLVIFYILFLLGKSLWINYDLRKAIEKLNQQIASLEQQKKDLNNLILYYKSDSFKELEARRKLGLKALGEKVMILPVTPTPKNFPEEVQKEKEQITAKKGQSQIPNWLLWWEFFTK